jgi:ABC-type amino acid transport substrate-binding protein
MRISRRHFIAGSVLAGFGASAQDTLRIGVPDFEPWSIENEIGLTGAIPKIFDEIREKDGPVYQYMRQPLQRQMADVQAGHLDLALGTLSQGMSSLQDYGLLVTLHLILVAPPGKHYGGTAELAGKLLGTIQSGVRSQPYFDLVKARQYNVPSMPAAIHMLMEGRIDGLLAAPATFLWHMKQLGLRRGAVGGFLSLPGEDIHVWARAGLWDDNLAARDRFIKALARLREDGSVDRIVAGYTPTLSP